MSMYVARSGALVRPVGVKEAQRSAARALPGSVTGPVVEAFSGLAVRPDRPVGRGWSPGAARASRAGNAG